MADVRIAAFDAQDAVGHEDVLAFWRREEALPESIARERVGEVHMVVLAEGDEIAAVSSAMLRDNDQLRMPMWHYRGFVGAAHRRTAIGLQLGLAGRDDLEQRYVSGRDTRAGGIVYELENPALRKAFPQAHWMPLDFRYVGDNEYGEPVRVHWFAGAPAAPPPQGST